MKICRVPMRSFAANCYLVVSAGMRCAIIDPGNEPESILAAVEETGCVPDKILLTHGHFDHIGAVEGIRRIHPDLPVIACRKELPVLLSPKMNYSRSALGRDITLRPDQTVSDGDTVPLDGLSFQVLETPGHTAGSLTFACGDVLFTGDTLFAGNCGRTDMYTGDPSDMADSLRRLRALDAGYRIYPGHEDTGRLSDQFDWIDGLLRRLEAHDH